MRDYPPYRGGGSRVSYDVSLVDDEGVAVKVPNHAEGGVVAVGGSTRADISITYNYSYFYYNEIDEDDGIRSLDGTVAEETIDTLESAVDRLGTEPHRDCKNYWCPSIGRAGKALDVLLGWAREHPNATWRVI